jgi:hypothetical protein
MRKFMFPMLLGLLSSCGGGDEAPSERAIAPDRTDPEVQELRRQALEKKPLDRVAPAQEPVTGEVPAALLEELRQDLATRVADDAVLLRRAEAVDWPDGSLGCPEPGMYYLQVVTPGYHVVFEVEGKSWDYRATEAGMFWLCETPPVGLRTERYPAS